MDSLAAAKKGGRLDATNGAAAGAKKAKDSTFQPGLGSKSKPSTTFFRDYRNSRAVLFDGIEEGGIRASSSYATNEIYEEENDRALDGLQDRVNILKRLTGDIHEEVESHNRLLDGMGNAMDSSRGALSRTVDRFKTVFETKASRRMATLVASFVVLFLLIYYLTK